MNFKLDLDEFDRPVWGFEYNGFFIHDPRISECGRFPVSSDYYGLTEDEAQELERLNGASNAAQ